MSEIARLLSACMLALVTTVIIGCQGETEDKVPQNLVLAAANYGEYVTLSWEEPIDGQPDEYIVYFREVDTTDWVIDTTLDGDVLEYTHNPEGTTGDYYVSADFDDTEYGSDTVTTIPEHTSEIIIYELNAGGNAGYGWDINDDFAGDTYSVAESTNVDSVDFYITNFILDPTGGPYDPAWSIAAPETLATDPGATFVPAANWRNNTFSDPTTSPPAILPLYSDTTYSSSTEGIENNPVYVGVHLNTEDYYALVKFADVNTTAGTIMVESWFQKVQGLRLVAH